MKRWTRKSFYAKVISNNRVTIPKRIADFFGFKKGDIVELIVERFVEVEEDEQIT